MPGLSSTAGPTAAMRVNDALLDGDSPSPPPMQSDRLPPHTLSPPSRQISFDNSSRRYAGMPDGLRLVDGHSRSSKHSARDHRYLPDGHGSGLYAKTHADGDAEYDGSASDGHRRNSYGSSDLSPSMSPEAGRRSHPAPLAAVDGAVDGVARKSSKRVRAGDDNLTIRRREANRLAAQRFRSRKKGYQDSLEDRIKVLEHEKELMARHADEFGHGGAGPSSLQDRSSSIRHMSADGHGDHMWSHPLGSRSSRNPLSALRSTSPDRRDGSADMDVRIAALESANRRLREEVRGLYEENAHLRDELRWRREIMRKHMDSDLADGENDDLRRSQEAKEPKDGHRGHSDENGRWPQLPPLDIAALSSGAYPTPSASYAPGVTQRSPLDPDSRPEVSTPGIQLAPLRWPQPRSGLPSAAPASTFTSSMSSSRPSPPRRRSHTNDKPC